LDLRGPNNKFGFPMIPLISLKGRLLRKRLSESGFTVLPGRVSAC
jgi:hypothetical protein